MVSLKEDDLSQFAKHPGQLLIPPCKSLEGIISMSGKGSLEGSSLNFILIVDGYPVTILLASFFWSALWRCPFVHNRVTACRCTWFAGLQLVWGFGLVCFPYRARRPWYFCIWQRVCTRQGRASEAWCVNDRSLGDAAGKLLIWLVWSWKLTRSHWKWLPLGISFILVYLFFPPLPWSFYTQGFCCCCCSGFFLVGWIRSFYYT